MCLYKGYIMTVMDWVVMNAVRTSDAKIIDRDEGKMVLVGKRITLLTK